MTYEFIWDESREPEISSSESSDTSDDEECVSSSNNDQDTAKPSDLQDTSDAPEPTNGQQGVEMKGTTPKQSEITIEMMSFHP